MPTTTLERPVVFRRSEKISDEKSLKEHQERCAELWRIYVEDEAKNPSPIADDEIVEICAEGRRRNYLEGLTETERVAYIRKLSDPTRARFLRNLYESEREYYIELFKNIPCQSEDPL